MLDSKAVRSKAPGKPRQLLVALLEGKTVAEAADQIGIARITAYHWLEHNERFQTALWDATDRLTERAVTRLAARLDRAIDRLDVLMEQGPESNQLKAVQTVLDGLVRLAEHVHPKTSESNVNVQVNVGLADRMRRMRVDVQDSRGQPVPVLAEPDRSPVGTTPKPGP